MVPVKFPVAVGSNHTWNVLDCPAGKEKGNVRPVTENCALFTVTALRLAVAFPVFVTVAVCETFFPTAMLPKLKVPGVT